MDAAKLGLRVEKLNGKNPTNNAFVGSAIFESKGVNLADPPTVPCNRNGDGCLTPIDSLQNHNSHKPWFETEEERDAWVQRIQEATEAAATGYEGEEVGE